MRDINRLRRQGGWSSKENASLLIHQLLGPLTASSPGSPSSD
jgi:hypothetical protein